MSIRVKLVISFLAIALIPALIGSIITFNNYKHSLEHSSISNIQNIADFTKDKITEYASHLNVDTADMSPINDIIQNLPELGNTGEVLIGKKSGNNIIFLNNLKYYSEPALNKKVTIGDKASLPIQEAAQGREGAGLSIDYRGEPVIAAWRYLPSLGWGIVAKIDAKEALSDVEELRKFIIMALGIIFCLATIVALFVARSIAVPIQKLAKGTEIIGRGNLDYKVGIDLRDEIGQLSRFFDKMTYNLKQTSESLKKTNETLEQRVEERTAQLREIADDLGRERVNLQKIFDVVNIGMLLIDERGIVKRINNVAAQWMGKDNAAVFDVRPGNALGCVHLLNNPAACGQTAHCSGCSIRATFEMVLNSGNPVHSVEAEASLLLDGKEERIWLDLSADPVFIEGKKCVILAINNITERKKIEDEFNRLNRTLKALSDNSNALMHSNNEKEYLEKVCNIVINDCGHQMVWIGFAEDDKSRSVRPVAQAGFEEGYIEALKITWADTERGRGPTGVAIRTGKPSLCRNMLTDPDFGPWREEALKRGYKSSIVLPLLDGNNVFGAINIYSDKPDPFSGDEIKLLTKLADDIAYGIKVIRLRVLEKQAEEILRRDKETFEIQVKEKTEELVNMHMQFERTKRLSDIGTLAATVAHELRNPLAAMNIAAANIRRKAANPSIEKHILSIEKKISESDQIISNLLFYSRIKPPQRENVNINNIIQECVDLLSENSRYREASIILNMDPTKEMLISADPTQVKEVFSNILNNAVDAVPKSGPGRIEIATGDKKGFIEFYVRDNGIGIDKEHLSKIFEPFFTTKAKGTGLGLSVCKHIVELHGGTIKIKSEPGKGTEVKITLPKM